MVEGVGPHDVLGLNRAPPISFGPMSILGNRVLRKEDPAFLTVGGRYVDDLPLPGAAFVTYVRSTMAHARITAVDVDEARAAPGVVAVFTGRDVDLDPIPPSMGFINQSFVRPWLAHEVTRYVGEPVVAIVTEHRYQGADAAELVSVDYDPLPVVVDPEESVKGEVLPFPDLGTNVALEFNFGRDEHLFDECDVVVRQRIVNQKVAPSPLEVRADAVQWGADGRLTWWVSTQSAHSAKSDLCRLLRLEPEQVRVVAPDVGGGFGAKIGVYPEELLLAWLARRVRRPLKWTETRS